MINPSSDLHKQGDQFALAMRVRLGKDGFQLIARRLPGNLQFAGGDIGRGAACDDAGELRFRRRQAGFCRKLCMAEACGMIAGNGSSGTAR
jgi:hypothetical protein